MDSSLEDLNTLVMEFRKFKSLQKEYTVEEQYKQIFLMDCSYYSKNDMWMCEELLNDETKKELGIKEEDAITDFEEVIPLMEEMEKTLAELRTEINTIEKHEKNTDYIELSLGDEEKFLFHTSTLGLRQKEYKEIGNDIHTNIPVYTAAAKPVIYFDRDCKTYTEKILP